MSRRNDKDPLLQAFLDTYRVNLLSIPRANADVGDAYVQDPKGAMSPPGRLKFLLTPDINLPRAKRDEELAMVKGKQTRAIDVNAGLTLLDGFFSAVGAAIGVDKVKAEFAHKNASKVRFQLKDATRDSIDPFAFGQALIPCRLNARQGFVQPGNRYYAITGVLRSRSITLHSETDTSDKVGLDLGVLQNAAGIKGKLGVTSDGEGEVTFTGDTPLAFGVELVEMLYDDQQEKFFLQGIRDAATVRADGKERRVFIGDEETGDVFLPAEDSRLAGLPTAPH